MSSPTERSPRRARLAAALVMLAWLLGSFAALLLFRGVPVRLRVFFVLGSLLGLIWLIGVLRARRREPR